MAGPKKRNDEEQPSLYSYADPEEVEEVASDFRFAELSMRAEALAIAGILVKIIAQNETEPVSLLDPYTLAMSAVSHVIDSLRLMTFEESSLTVKELEDRISEDIKTQYTALYAAGRIETIPSYADAQKTASGIVDKLLARREGGSMTQQMYTPQSNNFRAYEYAMFLQYYDSVEGNLHVRLTPEGANLYLNSLAQPLGDMQAALGALVERQIAKGDYASALKTAAQHRNLTFQHRSEILTLKRKIERNTSGIRWLEAVEPQLVAVYMDVPFLLTQDQRIYDTLRSNTIAFQGKQAALARQVVSIIHECFVVYRTLKVEVMRLPEIYRSARVQEGYFTSQSMMPHIETALLSPYIKEASSEVLDEMQPVIMAGFCGITVPECIDIKYLVQKLTVPRRETTEVFDPTGVPDLEKITTESIQNISDEGRRHALSALRGIQGKETQLSKLIARVEEDADTKDVSEALILFALQAWRDNGYAGLAARKTGTTFQSRYTAGDDMFITYIHEDFGEEE